MPDSQKQRTYIAIDLKSFYASVECKERGLDPMTTNLVVADPARTEKTICLAVSPSLKAYGIPGRPRLFEVVQRVREVNAERQAKAPKGKLLKESYNDTEVKDDPACALAYVTAPPRMALYMEYSTKIYHIYLNYIAPEDIHVYSIDEVFMDVTDYLNLYRLTPEKLAMKMILDVLQKTGITATAGIGTNLYLSKVAMDIVAKHIPANRYGVRIARLNELTYRKLLWTHEPLTDFWRVGRGYEKKLKENGLFTMGDIARCSIGTEQDYYNEELLYRLFGVNAELLIDHAWGWEPCTIRQIREYEPEFNSISSGQVLQCPYDFAGGRMIVREMTELLVLELVEKGLVTEQMILTVGYDRENLMDEARRKKYKGAVTSDRYGRKVPKHAHGTVNLDRLTSSTKQILEAVLGLYDSIVDENLLVRRINVTANHVVFETSVQEGQRFEQLRLFTDYEAREQERRMEKEGLEREKRLQKAMISIKKKYGKNAILKGTNLQEGSMARERNNQIGGHKA